MSNKIQYRRVGDYFIPNLILPPEEANITLGKWGMMHKTYLENHKKVFFIALLVILRFQLMMKTILQTQDKGLQWSISLNPHKTKKSRLKTCSIHRISVQKKE